MKRTVLPLLGLIALDGCSSTHTAPQGAARPDEMVAIPAATFTMGKPEGVGDTWEHPQHVVSLRPFSLDRQPVTVSAYAACVQSGACTAAGTEQRGTDGAGPEQDAFCNGAGPERGDNPVTCVDWNQANAYCASVGKRLPTEEEWEYAAKGPHARKYPWGDDAPSAQLCWNRLPGSDYAHAPGTCAVGTHSAGASPFGVEDMAGNVWEWTATVFAAGYDKPKIPDARAIRGGGWRDADPKVFESASRNGSTITDRVVNLGFRCAR